VPVYTDRSEPISQGDLFRAIPFTVPRGDYERTLVQATGIVLSRDCDCDDAVKTLGEDPEAEAGGLLLSMAPILLFSTVSTTDGFHGHVRSGRVMRHFYIEPEDDQEAFVTDFQLVQPVPVGLILGSDRVGSLSDDWRGRMVDHYWNHMTRDEGTPRQHPTPKEGADGA